MRATHVGLSSDLLKRLPLFDEASIDEIVDIRKELARPLIRFRSAMISFSREIESAAWEKEFALEVERIFRQHVEPAVLELEESCRSNKLLLKLVPNYFTKEVAASSVLGVVLGHVSQLPELMAGLGLVAGATIATLESVKEWHEKNNQIETHQLYFYYKEGKQFSQ